jgi:hypothetical protein
LQRGMLPGFNVIAKNFSVVPRRLNFFLGEGLQLGTQAFDPRTFHAG